MPKNACSIRVLPIELPIAIRNILTCFRRCGRGIRRKHWINWQELWARDFSANQGRKSGGILDVFPIFSDEEWTEKIHPQPQTIYSVLPNGAAFRQRPLSRLLINFLAGTRKLPPEEPNGKLPGDILAIHKLDFFGKGGKPSLIFRLFQRLHSVCRVILRGHRKKEAEL